MNTFFKKNVSAFIILAAVLVGITTFVFQRPHTFAGVPIASADTVPPGCDSDPAGMPLCGYAWGATDEGEDTGIGWISFNSDDAGGGPYKVTVSSDGTLRGCAWSPNIGWVKFHDLSDNPHLNSSGNSTLQAALETPGSQTSNLKGWARACAATVNAADPEAPGDCTTMQTREGGWDGWISLKGTAGSGSYGVATTNGTFAGFSWGGDVVGYLDWGHTTTSGPVRFCNAGAFDFNISSANSITVEQGEVRSLPITISKVGTGASQQVTLSASFLGPTPSTGNISAVLTPLTGTPTFSSTLEVRPSLAPPDSATVPVGVYPLTIRGISADGLTERTKVININVVSPNQPDHVVVCEPPPASELPAYVNRPVRWRVTVTRGDGSTPTEPFMYRTDFDGVISNPIGPVSGGSLVISRTYTTIGQKHFRAGVVENDGSVSWCTGASILVRVNPDIIER